MDTVLFQRSRKMSQCVLVREFSPEEAVSLEVKKHVDALQGYGFSVLWGGAKPVLQRVRASGEVPSRDEVSEIVSRLLASGLKKSGVALLVGVTRETVRRWETKGGDISIDAWKSLKRLASQAKSASPNDLRAEARGAAIASRNARRVSDRVATQDKYLEITTRRDSGESVRSLAREFGVTEARIYQISREVRLQTSA
jgi:transposase-like protein